MRLFKRVMSAGAFLLLASAATTDDTQGQENTTVVIAPFEVSGWNASDLAERANEGFLDWVLYLHPEYRILERNALDRLFRELRFTLTYDNTSRAAEAGQLLGADYIVFTKVRNRLETERMSYPDYETGRPVYLYRIASTVTIKTVSLRDGSISDMYISEGDMDEAGQGTSERDIYGESLTDHFVLRIVDRETFPWVETMTKRLR